MTLWLVSGSSNQSTSTFPLLQEVVPTAKPTWVTPWTAPAPNCAIEGKSPTIISGPGTASGTSRAPLGRTGRLVDWGPPFTAVVTSIGYMLVVIEISPTTRPASAGRLNLLASSAESKSLPPSILSKCAVASYL